MFASSFIPMNHYETPAFFHSTVCQTEWVRDGIIEDSTRGPTI